MFLQNTWYVACMSEEVSDRPLGRRICGHKIVFYRDAESTPIALEDFCPHRGLPLSLGYVENGNLVCGYHGLQMGCDGKSRSMPNQQVDRFPCIRSYPVVERYGFVWVWPGDPQKASVEDIPDFVWGDNPDWAFGGGLYHINCDYLLMIDNLMDLTHETYVHSDSIGQKEIDEAPVKTEIEGTQVKTSRVMDNIEAPPFWKMALRENGMPDDILVDRWQICRFTPPSHIMIDVGVATAGYGGYEADPAHKTAATVVDFITPESENSMWYFWGMARSFKPESQALTDKIRDGQGGIFAEDLEILEQQQRSLEEHPDRRLMTLNIDAGGRHSRMLLEKMLAAERDLT